MKKIITLALASLFVSSAVAVTISESFSTNPSLDGWKIFGNTNLFAWDSAHQDLAVTWDSSQTNSGFYHPLGTVLAEGDDFSVEFDLRLTDYVAGNNPAMPSTFPLSVAFLNLAEVEQATFYRGSGYTSPDLVEFSFFPDPGGGWQWGPSLTASMVDSTAFDWSSGGFAPNALASNSTYHVSLVYTAVNSNLVMNVTENGQPFVSDVVASLPGSFTDFRADAISITSYNDGGQDMTVYTNTDGTTTIYAGSLLAHGVVTNIVVVVPPPPVQNLTGGMGNGIWQAQFTARTNWVYTLQRTADFQAWTDVLSVTNDVAGLMSLSETNPPVDQAFYRIRAARP